MNRRVLSRTILEIKRGPKILSLRGVRSKGEVEIEKKLKLGGREKTKRLKGGFGKTLLLPLQPMRILNARGGGLVAKKGFLKRNYLIAQGAWRAGTGRKDLVGGARSYFQRDEKRG